MEVNMNILILGGTRYIGKHIISSLLSKNYNVTIATRGKTPDPFGDLINRIVINERNDIIDIQEKLKGRFFDIIIDNLAFDSNNVKILLENIECKKYLFTSSAAVYDKHINTVETDFSPFDYPIKWVWRDEGISFREGKRLAEATVFQYYNKFNPIAVRLPFVIGKDDYTKRMYYYIYNIINKKPLNINNMDNRISFVNSQEAGKFISFLIGTNYVGPINGCNNGTVKLRQLIEYVEDKTQVKAIYDSNSEPAPYNDQPDHYISNTLALDLGFAFTDLSNWIYKLIDYYIAQVER
jgi:nucleoside-diphosphate-sugar epimerase